MSEETVNRDMSGAGARVMREILRTPAFREIIRLHLLDIDPRAARLAVRVMFEEAPDLPLGTIALTSKIINSLVGILLEFGSQIDRFPPDLLEAFLMEIVEEIDGEAFARTITSYSEIIARIQRDHPDLANRIRPAVEAALNTADFGKIREGVTELSNLSTALTVVLLDSALKNPVVLANILLTLAPLLNNSIGLCSHALSRIDLPPEVLAGSLFNMIEGIDREELGRAVTGVSKLVNDLHEGNVVLGREEPRFKEVLVDFIEGVLDHVDTEETADALEALGEDLQGIQGVFSELLHRDPRFPALILAGVIAAQKVVMRGISNVLSETARLDDDAVNRMGATLERNLDVSELGHIVDNTVLLADRLAEIDPDRYKRMFRNLTAAIDSDRLGGAVRSAARELAVAAGQDTAVRNMLEPEEVGGYLNSILVRFNRHADSKPTAARDYFTRMWNSVDPDEFERAMKNLMGGITAALLSSTRLGMVVVRLLASAGWNVVRFMGLSLKKRIFRRV